MSFLACLYSPTSNVLLPSDTQKAVEDALRILIPPLSKCDSPPASVLLQAPPSGGKSLVCSRVIQSLISNPSINPHIIHLRGLLHSTPQRAWRAVAISLSCYTTSSSQNEQDDDQNSKQLFEKATVDTCLGAIRDILNAQRQNQQLRPLLFILDDFERFAISPDGPSQNVIYSLLNFLQDRTIKAACLAMTSHLDVTDNLEKRVKSRFSCREIVIQQPTQVNEIITFIHSVLQHSNKEDKSIKQNDLIKGKLKKKRMKTSMKVNEDKEAITLNIFVGKLISDDRFKRCIRKSLARTRVIAPILHGVQVAISTGINYKEINMKSTSIDKCISVACTAMEASLENRDPYELALEGLSALEMALLVSLRKIEQHIVHTSDKSGIVFEDVFEQYESVSSGEEGILSMKEGERTAARDVAEKSFERLIECGLVVRQGQRSREMGQLYVAIDNSDIDTALKNHPLASTTLQRWGRVI